jgi:hypothetical protein
MSLSDDMKDMYIATGAMLDAEETLTEGLPDGDTFKGIKKMTKEGKKSFEKQLDRKDVDFDRVEPLIDTLEKRVRECKSALEKEKKRIKDTEELISSTEAQIDKVNQVTKKLDPSAFDQYLINEGFDRDVVAKRPGGGVINKELHMRTYHDKLADAKKSASEAEVEITNYDSRVRVHRMNLPHYEKDLEDARKALNKIPLMSGAVAEKERKEVEKQQKEAEKVLKELTGK